jgi:hypothetical protein
MSGFAESAQRIFSPSRSQITVLMLSHIRLVPLHEGRRLPLSPGFLPLRNHRNQSDLPPSLQSNYKDFITYMRCSESRGLILLFDPRREHSSAPDRQFQSPPRRRDNQRWPQFCGQPQGLGLDGPEQGGMLAWRGLKGGHVMTCNFKLVVLGHFSPLFYTTA